MKWIILAACCIAVVGLMVSLSYEGQASQDQCVYGTGKHALGAKCYEGRCYNNYMNQCDAPAKTCTSSGWVDSVDRLDTPATVPHCMGGMVTIRG